MEIGHRPTLIPYTLFPYTLFPYTLFPYSFLFVPDIGDVAIKRSLSFLN